MRTAEREPWRSVEVPCEYSAEYSITLTYEETSSAGLEGIIFVCTKPRRVLVPTNQTGKPQDL